MRCRYFVGGRCKNKAVVWYFSIGVCEEHKAEILAAFTDAKNEMTTIPPALKKKQNKEYFRKYYEEHKDEIKRKRIRKHLSNT